MQRSVLGERHPAVARTLELRSDLFERRGAIARADSAATEALAVRVRVYGPSHIETVTSLRRTATVKARNGDLDGAEELLRIAVELLHEQFRYVRPRASRHSLRTREPFSLRTAITTAAASILTEAAQRVACTVRRRPRTRGTRPPRTRAFAPRHRQRRRSDLRIRTRASMCLNGDWAQDHELVAETISDLAAARARSGDVERAADGFARSVEIFEADLRHAPRHRSRWAASLRIRSAPHERARRP